MVFFIFKGRANTGGNGGSMNGGSNGGNGGDPPGAGGNGGGSGLILNPKVAELRNATFYNADGDAHPNDKGHEWRSTVIENWIRSL